MKTCFLLFAATLIIGVIMIIFGKVSRKKLSPAGAVYVPLCGIIIVIASVIVCLCLGWFLR